MPYIITALGVAIVVVLATLSWDKERPKDGAGFVAVGCYTALLFAAGIVAWLLNFDVMPPGEVLSRVFVPLPISLVALPVGIYLLGLRIESLAAALSLWNVGMSCVSAFVGFVGFATWSPAVFVVGCALFGFMLLVDFLVLIGLGALGLRSRDTRRATGTALLVGGLTAALMAALLYLPDLGGWQQVSAVGLWTVAIALGPALFSGVRIILHSMPGLDEPSDDLSAEWSRLLKRSRTNTDAQSPGCTGPARSEPASTGSPPFPQG